MPPTSSNWLQLSVTLLSLFDETTFIFVIVKHLRLRPQSWLELEDAIVFMYAYIHQEILDSWMKLPKQMLAINLHTGTLTAVINWKNPNANPTTQPRASQHRRGQREALQPLRDGTDRTKTSQRFSFFNTAATCSAI